MKIKAEYIWIDGLTPTGKLRSKTKIMEQGTEPPTWGFDGSSTQQATGDQSDCVLKPVAQFPDPIRGGDNISNVRSNECRYDTSCFKYKSSTSRISFKF